MEPRILRVERVFPNSFLREGCDYTWFQMVFDSLIEEIKLLTCGFFINKQATFVLNREMYRLFYSVAPMIKGPYWNGIYVKEDLTPEWLPWNTTEERKGRILLEYREPVYIQIPEGIKIKTSITEKELEAISELTERRNAMPPKDGNTGIYEEQWLKKFYEKYCVEDAKATYALWTTGFYDGFIGVPHIDHVIFNPPATIVLWNDGTKTVVKCQKGDDYDPEKGLAMAIAKKALGNTSRKLNDVLHKWEKKEEPSVRHSCSKGMTFAEFCEAISDTPLNDFLGTEENPDGNNS